MAITDPPPEPGEIPRFDLAGRTLREHTARGTLINSAFMTGLSLLGLVRGFVLAAFLTRGDYGVFGILAVSLGTLLWIKQVGIGDKFIQQEEDDQEVAFQKAFTLELLSTGVMVVVLLIALPGFCLLYDEWKLLAPGLVIILAILPLNALRAPVWIFYRRMDFFRERLLQAIEPVVSFVASVALAIGGLGYWALILGMLAGTLAATVVTVISSPYKLALRFDTATLRSYWTFSWPLLLGTGGGVVIAQSGVIAVDAHLGLAAVGVLALAANITQLINRVDSLVTGTLYPAICSVADRTELLYESFVKSNRLALMWAMPFGVGLALYAGDLVSYGIGEEWRPAVGLLQAYGLIAAVHHIGFNWDAYFRARGETKPIAVASVAAAVAFLAVGIPLLLVYDLPGFAVGVAVQSLVHVAVRAFYLRRLFHGFSYLRHATRSMLPTIPAAAAVLALRAADVVERSLAVALAELALYVAITIAATWVLERPLLREMAGYVAGARQRPAAAL